MNLNKQYERPRSTKFYTSTDICDYPRSYDSAMQFSDILSAINTTQPSEQQPILLEQKSKTRDFIHRLQHHITELCLTKLSVSEVQGISAHYVSVLNTMPIHQCLCEYLQEVIPHVQYLISRLRSVNASKFKLLIKRKLGDIFNEIMRQAYDMKTYSVAQLVQQNKSITRTGYAFEGLCRVLLKASNVQRFFARCRAISQSFVRSNMDFMMKLQQKFKSLNLIASSAEAKAKYSAFYHWNRQARLITAQSNKDIDQLCKTIFLEILRFATDPAAAYRMLSHTVKSLAANPEAEILYFDAVSNTLCNKYDEAQARKPDSEECKCLEDREIVHAASEENGYSRIMIPIFSNSDDAFGLITIPFVVEPTASTIENLLNFAKKTTWAIEKLISISSRISYYKNDCRSTNEISRLFLGEYLNDHDSEDMKHILDKVLSQIGMSYVDIVFAEELEQDSLSQGRIECLYKFTTDQPTPAHIDLKTFRMFISEFLNRKLKQQKLEESEGQQHLDYLSVNKMPTQYSIFPYWEGKHIKALVRICFNYQVNMNELVQIVDLFIRILIAKVNPILTTGQSPRNASQQQSLKQIGENLEDFTPRFSFYLVQNIYNLLRATTYEDVEDALQECIRKAGSSFGMKYYSSLLWPYFTRPDAHSEADYWFRIGSDCNKIPPWLNISSLLKSPLQFRTVILDPHQQMATWIRQFPLYQSFRLQEYQQQNTPMRLIVIPIRSSLGENVNPVVLLIAHYHQTEVQKLDRAIPEVENTRRSQATVSDLETLVDLSRVFKIKVDNQVCKSLKFEDINEKRSVDQFFEIMKEVASANILDISNLLNKMCSRLDQNSSCNYYTISKRGTLLRHLEVSNEEIVAQLQGLNPAIDLPQQVFSSKGSKVIYSYKMRGKRLAVSEKKVLFLFNSSQLKQKFCDLVDEDIQEQATIVNLEPSLTSSPSDLLFNQIKDNLMTDRNKTYLYFPIGTRGFVVVSTNKNWSQFEIAHLQACFLQQIQLYKEVCQRNLSLKKYNNIKALVSLQEKETTNVVRKTIKHWRYQLLNRNQSTLTAQESLAKIFKKSLFFLKHAFDKIRTEALSYEPKLASRDKNVQYFEGLMRKLMFCTSFKQIKNYALQVSQECYRKRYALQSLSGIRNSFTRYLVQDYLSLLKSKSLADQKHTKIQKQKKLAQLNTILVKKQISAIAEALEKIRLRSSQFLEFFNIVAQQVNLVRFRSRQHIQKFLEERITLTIQSMKFAQKDIKIVFRFQSNSLPSTKLSDKTGLWIYKWPIEETSDRVVLQCSIPLTYGLQESVNVLVERICTSYRCVDRLRTVRSKCLLASLCSLYNSNMKSVMSNLRKLNNFKSQKENVKSRQQIRDMDIKLNELRRELEDKQNDCSVNKQTLPACKKSIAGLESKLTEIKINNRINRKTLATSIMQTLMSEKEGRLNELQIGFNRIRTVANYKKAHKTIISKLFCQRLWGGCKILDRIKALQSKRLKKGAFELILNQACGKRWN